MVMAMMASGLKCPVGAVCLYTCSNTVCFPSVNYSFRTVVTVQGNTIAFLAADHNSENVWQYRLQEWSS